MDLLTKEKSVYHSKFKFWTNRKIGPPIDLPIPSRIATPIDTNHITDSNQSTIESRSILSQLSSISSLDQIQDLNTNDKNEFQYLLSRFKAIGLTNRAICNLADIAIEEIDERYMIHLNRS